MSPLNCFFTWRADVGLKSPNLLALGAAIGFLNSLIRLSAISLLGCLKATVFKPALTSKLISVSFNLSRIIVRGPGQNFSVSLSIFLLNTAIFFACSTE